MVDDSIVKVFWNRVKTMPDRPACMYKSAGSYRPVTWKEQGRTVELVAAGLMSLGLERGDHIVIMSQSRPHWTWADLSILSAAAVTVPVYPTLSPPEVLFLFNHSDSVGGFVENERQANKILESSELPPKLKFMVVVDGPVPTGNHSIQLLTWADLLKRGEEYLAAHTNAVMARAESVKKDDLATVVYTSGTTGVPKGVMLLHSNIFGVLQAMSPLVNLKPDDIALSFLPLSHVYERVGGQFLAVFDGLILAYAESIESVPQNLLEVRPTVITGVPRFYEKVYQRIQLEVKKRPKASQYVLNWALSVSRRAHRKNSNGQGSTPSPLLSSELRIADQVVFSRIRHRFGGRLRIMVSGAAPLAEEVRSFFECIGLHILEGYGLTETAAPVACNTPEINFPGSVGRPLPGIEVKIAEDGEILVRGSSVFAGYYKNTEATDEAFVDGWFRTGDIGDFDENGFLHIRDRKKDIIITSGGKHVAPQFIENMFRSEPLVSNIIVYGDRRKYITALITLSRDGMKTAARNLQIPFKSVEELVHHPKIREELDAMVNRKNETLASFERIKKYAVLDGDFTAEADEMTPTFKLKRKVIVERYRSVLDGLYDRQDLELEDGVPR